MTNVLLLPIVGGVTINHIPLDITYHINDKTSSCMTRHHGATNGEGVTINHIPLDIT